MNKSNVLKCLFELAEYSAEESTIISDDEYELAIVHIWHGSNKSEPFLYFITCNKALWIRKYFECFYCAMGWKRIISL